ncbi:GPALPP motifs-containing protein 1-like [Oppia nitens]|uniref:GPALPP motifs-containing protein 1-like n=1 Tax=Oppia nitens TaxID=1686743 RepID=UPI0023DAE9F1|nr:GPALPP motifs-containing protein 1-like [Oppia nitens]
MSNPMIGPTLPPHLRPNANKQSEDIDDDNDNQVYGPSLVSDVKPCIGPTLPPGFQIRHNEDDDSNDGKDESAVIGPTLPQHLKYLENAINESNDDSYDKMAISGPSLECDDSDSDSDSDDMIGPVLPSHYNYDKLNKKFGDSSQILSKINANKDIKKQREEWMTEIPTSLAPKLPTKSVTQFSQRPVNSVKSDDNIRDKCLKRDQKEEQELTEMMDSFNKAQNRDISLIDVHQNKSKKMKKEMKSNPELEERVEFDREKDLSVRKMNSRQTKSILNKAKTFNDRFSLGVNKFL